MTTQRHIFKQLISLVIALMVVFFAVSVASANGGPHNGVGVGTPDCVSCHRINSVSGTQSLLVQDTTTLCMSCHGTGLGANTNVADGIYMAGGDDYRYNEGLANTPDGAPLLGGGFVSYKGKPVTSAHDVVNGGSLAWGNGVARGASASLAKSMDCASCHDPHGSSNYRMLRETINGKPVSVEQVDEGAAKDYDTENWGAGVDSLCAACHGSYNVTSAGSGSDIAMVSSGGYTHRVGMSFSDGNNVNPETIGFEGYTLPLAQSGNGDLVACMTCHLPHGTSATTSDGRDTNLIRMDNSGVCQVCHQL